MKINMFQCILNAFSGEGGGIEDMCDILAKKRRKKKFQRRVASRYVCIPICKSDCSMPKPICEMSYPFDSLYSEKFEK